MRRLLTSATICTTLLCAALATAQTDGQPDGDPDQTAPPAGILPVPPYDGDLWTRSYLLGDLGGTRTDLAEKGFQFTIDWSQTLQSITDGGRDETTQYGGTLDYYLTLDLQKMGVIPGGVIAIRAESRYGNSVNGSAGPLLPVNIDAFFPITNPADEDVAMTITALNYTQYLSPTFAVFLGKVDTLDGDLNEFASGRGLTQFQNANFIFSSAGSLTVPYSTLAVGALWVASPHVTLTTSFMNAADSSTSSGFDDFGDGWNWAAEMQFQYRLAGLPGGSNVGGMYTADSNFLKLGSRLIFQPGVGLTLPTKNESWFVYWSSWQYIFTEEEPGDGPMNLINRKPDLQGVGLFARVGFADQDTNPVEWTVSGGIGGRGIMPGRDDDNLGLGYYYTQTNTDRLTGAGLIDDHTQGFEAFYNWALSPSASLTLNAQVVTNVFPGTDDAVILGARLGLRF